jgi:hypothetical protein
MELTLAVFWHGMKLRGAFLFILPLMNAAAAPHILTYEVEACSLTAVCLFLELEYLLYLNLILNI